MKAIIILKRCRAARNDIERLQQRIDQWQDVLTSLSAPQADPNGGSRGSGDKDKTGRIYAEIDALEREKTARQERAEVEKMATRALMDMVPDLEGKILFDYYARGWDTPRIAREEKYTAGYVRKIGKGRFCALTPGHNPAVFENPDCLKLLKQALRRCAGE